MKVIGILNNRNNHNVQLIPFKSHSVIQKNRGNYPKKHQIIKKLIANIFEFLANSKTVHILAILDEEQQKQVNTSIISGVLMVGTQSDKLEIQVVSKFLVLDVVQTRKIYKCFFEKKSSNILKKTFCKKVQCFMYNSE